jgi:hypothetical protein
LAVTARSTLGRLHLGRLGAFINANVIDQHVSRKYRGGVRAPRPIATHGQIEDQKVGLIENPLPSSLEVSARAADIEILVDVEGDRVGIPLEGEKNFRGLLHQLPLPRRIVMTSLFAG